MKRLFPVSSTFCFNKEGRLQQSTDHALGLTNYASWKGKKLWKTNF
jgi:hypothetical protein